MNLHRIAINGQRALVWVSMRGGNGRHLGTHAWEVDEGEPPTTFEPRPGWVTDGYRYWLPNRYRWEPFKESIERLFLGGYVRPLCGWRSRSRWPRATMARNHGYNTCADCARIANQRGTLILDSESTRTHSPAYQQTREEFRRWDQAGRPDPSRM